MINATLVPVLEKARVTSLATGATQRSIPVGLGERGVGSERTAAAKRAVLQVSRDRDGTSGALSGTLAVYGADLPNALSIGTPLGNSFAQAATATSVRPQVALLATDGSTTAFTTSIDLASGDLAAAIAGITNAIVVRLPKFRITGAALAGLRAAMDSTGLITTYDLATGATPTAYDSALAGGTLAAGDTVEIGGYVATITSLASASTIQTDLVGVTVDAATAATRPALYCNSPKRRYLKVVAGSAGVDADEVEATVVNSKLVLTFKVAPPSLNLAVSGIGVRGIPSIDPPAVYLVTPTQVLADGTNPFVRAGIRSRSVMWTIGTATADGAISASKVYVEHSAE